MENNGTQQSNADPIPFARCYQLEALDKAIKQNTIVFLETGSGKTLIAIMLLRSYAYSIRKPSRSFAVFLVPKVVLVTQQAEALKMHTDLKVGMYWGEMGVDHWDAATWNKQQDEFEVLVMTHMILLNALRHSFLKLDDIKVLIFDECHNARGNHGYACIMKEFYHRYLGSNSQVPRIFGMTASPVKSKDQSSSSDYWNLISQLENLMNSKVYTCESDSVLAKYIPFSTPKLKIYKHVDIPYELFVRLAKDLKSLKEEHDFSLNRSKLTVSAAESVRKKLTKLFSTFLFCLDELGVWLALKASESLSSEDTDIFLWGKLDVCGETIVRDFVLDVSKVFSRCLPSVPGWSIAGNIKANMDAGYLTSKVNCLIESLLEYRDMKDLRCIIFVERVITAIALQVLLTELLPEQSGWKTEYTAGNQSKLQSQSRTKQNEIVEEFRKGRVNIIVATSILEEGLDVQSCNLVIRFDPSATVCSFIQSRGRARMQNSDFLLMVRSGDASTLSRVKNYLASGDVMRKESLSHASVPCAPLDCEFFSGVSYRVETTDAFVTLSSSVGLIHFYCSRLPSDGYFKPSPRFNIDEEMETCTLYLPKSCPVPNVCVKGNIKMLKQLACLEACKQLHQKGALTDNLVPDMVVEEAVAQELENEIYSNDQAKYFPPELVSPCVSDSMNLYHCYLIQLRRNFDYNIPLHDIVFALRTELELDDDNMTIDLETDRGGLTAHMKYVGHVKLNHEQVLLCQRFQLTIFRVLLDHNLNKLREVLEANHLGNDLPVCDYLLLPSTGSHHSPPFIDWKCVYSVIFPYKALEKDHTNCSLPEGCAHRVQTKNGSVCSCMLENSLVYTPHNSHLYCLTGALRNLDGNSLLTQRNGDAISYKKYFKLRHGIDLCFERQSLLNGRHIFPVQNYLQRCRDQKEKEPSNASVEVPPELCFIVMSPISISTFYSFSFIPSIMHRIESLLIAVNLKKMLAGHCKKNIPTFKVLEAITTKKCQEKFHLESLETIGDSFLKYAVSQQLFKTYQKQHEGLLSLKKDKIISNAALCKLGVDCKLPGFIHTEPFDPKMWIIPGDRSGRYALEEESISPKGNVYNRGIRKVKRKTVADVVEALIGAYLITGDELAALSLMDWLGIKVDFINIPYERDFPVKPEKLLNITYLESLLKYSFRDPSLLVEALTHGSYMLPEIPTCYQRLEYLGDSVLDYLITMHLCHKYPGISPGLLTDLRSASVNNECYAQSAVKARLHKHILHASPELHKHIVCTVNSFEQLSLESTFGWQSETTFPKVLGDIIESLAGAIFIDSGNDKERVFQSIRPLLEPLITPETMTLHPVKELEDLCQKKHYNKKKTGSSRENGVSFYTVEVEANGITYKHSCTAEDKKTAKKLAAKAVLNSLKEGIDGA